jgi:UDP-glucose 4-epimerase
MGRRVLITGLDSFWGGRTAQALEADPEVEMLLGLGAREPSHELERTEYVRTDQAYSILSRIVRATQVDTIVHTFLVVDSTQVSGRALHEINVIGTMNLLAAAGQPGSRVRQVVVKSSTQIYGSASTDPYLFREEMKRTSPVTSRVERSLLEVESLVRDYADDNPDTVVTLMRFANVLGTDIVTPISSSLSHRIAPCVAGYDPLLQFVEEDDVVRSLEHVTRNRIPGIYNVAGDGRLPWSEVAAICGARRAPLPPVGTRAAARVLGLTRIAEFPPEWDNLLRYGRGVDTSRLKSTGYGFRYTTAGAVENFIRAVRLRRSSGTAPPGYTYEADVEQFFRHSPAVVRDAEDASG